MVQVILVENCTKFTSFVTILNRTPSNQTITKTQIIQKIKNIITILIINNTE